MRGKEGVDGAPDVHTLLPLAGLFVVLALSTLGISQAGAPQAAEKLAGRAALTWNLQRVDAPKQFFERGDRSLRLDADGHPHIAYGGDFLYYAWYDGAVWRFDTVDDIGTVGRFASLALDAFGRPHISYQDGTNEDLKYARWTGSTWAVATVDTAGNVGVMSSLAVDALGDPHIAYWADYPEADLKYAHRTGSGAWVIETVDSAGVVGFTVTGAGRGRPSPHQLLRRAGLKLPPGRHRLDHRTVASTGLASLPGAGYGWPSPSAIPAGSLTAPVGLAVPGLLRP
jgi:hypothetical protein